MILMMIMVVVMMMVVMMMMILYVPSKLQSAFHFQDERGALWIVQQEIDMWGVSEPKRVIIHWDILRLQFDFWVEASQLVMLVMNINTRDTTHLHR